MDCDTLQFHSQTADWNVVSMATRYVSVINNPKAVPEPQGKPLDAHLRGYVVDVLSRDQAERTYPQYSDDIQRHAPKGKFALVVNPQTNQPLLDSQNSLVMLPASVTKEAGIKTMVSWRADSGVILQPEGERGISFLHALRTAFPEVNMIRLDMNAQTVANPLRAQGWHDFADAAAQMGYRLIIQNSDGAFAGGYLPGPTPQTREMLTLAQIGPAGALHSEGTSADDQIRTVRSDWDKMLKWFALPENHRIQKAVIGWELINEPMAYGNSKQAGRVYAQQMHDLIRDLDWGDKKILVGGLQASAQFGQIDLTPIRQAAGDRLIWSVHIYPDWVAAKRPDSEGIHFRDEICKRIGALAAPGDNIVVTETQLQPSPELLNPWLGAGRIPAAYNMAREFPWFGDNGIGLTWWPPVGRASSLMTFKDQKWHIVPDLTAFAHWGWGRGENPPPQDDGGHFGTLGNDRMGIGHNGQGLVHGGDIATPYGLMFGLAGDDTLTGADEMDMLYGGPGNDVLYGNAGRDFLLGDQGDDTLDGGAGADVLIDPEGHNLLIGGAGDDHLEGLGTLQGNDGDDVLMATPGNSTLTGGTGDDRFVPSPRGQVHITDFTPSTDVLDMVIAGGIGGSQTYDIRNTPTGATLQGGTLRVLVNAPLSCADLRTINGLVVRIDGIVCPALPRQEK